MTNRGQTKPTIAALVAALASASLYIVWVRQGDATVTGTATRRCVGWKAGHPDSATQTIRCYSARIPPGKWGTAADAGPKYAAFEVQIETSRFDGGMPGPAAIAAARDLADELDIIPDECETRASPVFASCSLAVLIQGDAQSPFKCACSSGASCTETLQDGGTRAVPKGDYTLAAGTWAGAGCVKKPCVEMDPVRMADGTLRSSSVPPECL